MIVLRLCVGCMCVCVCVFVCMVLLQSAAELYLRIAKRATSRTKRTRNTQPHHVRHHIERIVRESVMSIQCFPFRSIDREHILSEHRVIISVRKVSTCHFKSGQRKICKCNVYIHTQPLFYQPLVSLFCHIRRYVTAGQVTAAGQRLQSATASEPHAVHADEPSSRRHDEPQYAAARAARSAERWRRIGGSCRRGYDEGWTGGYAAEYGCDSEVCYIVLYKQLKHHKTTITHTFHMDSNSKNTFKIALIAHRWPLYSGCRRRQSKEGL